MGRQIKLSRKESLAYIAGFLDGDGSIMIQFKKRSDNKKLRVMITICFYQDSRHDKPLHWIKNQLGIGYISRRNDRMTELRINGLSAIKSILSSINEYIRFKKKQVALVLRAIDILEKTSRGNEQLLKIARLSDKMAKENYFSSKRKYDYAYVRKILNA